jgi:hypothetical protein
MIILGKIFLIYLIGCILNAIYVSLLIYKLFKKFSYPVTLFVAVFSWAGLYFFITRRDVVEKGIMDGYLKQKRKEKE